MFLKSANNWWERSPNGSNSTNFCNVNSDGSANNNNANNTNGVAPFGYIKLDRKVVKMKLYPKCLIQGNIIRAWEKFLANLAVVWLHAEICLRSMTGFTVHRPQF